MTIEASMNCSTEESCMQTKNRSVILDANVLIASLNPHDTLYKRAIVLLKNIEPREKIVTSLILAEVGTVLLLVTKDAQTVGNILRSILAGKTEKTAVYPCSNDFLAQTVMIFSQQEDPRLSVQDCSLIAIARRKKTKYIATFDRGLRKIFAREFVFLPTKL